MPPKRPQPTKQPAPLSQVAKTTNNTKAYGIGSYDDDKSGERVIIFAEGGMGKSTLALLAPNPLLLPVSDGSKRIHNAITGKKPIKFNGITNFGILLDVLADDKRLEPFDTIILDDLSVTQTWAKDHIVANYRVKGQVADNFRSFGWDGAAHLVSEFIKLQTLIDRQITKGKNFVGIAHESVTNVANVEQDFIVCSMDMVHQKNDSTRDLMFHWADYVVQINWADKEVTSEARNGKLVGKVSGQERAVFTQREANCYRKARALKNSDDPMPAVVSFDHTGDCSFWAYLFPDRYELVDESAMTWKLV